MTDFRALCAELTEFVARLTKHYHQPAELLTRARAALADEPDVSNPPGPTDQDLLRLYKVATPCYKVEEYKRELDFARAVLARWGNPAPVPGSERLLGPEDCDVEHYCWRWNRIKGLWEKQPWPEDGTSLRATGSLARDLPLPEVGNG